MQQSKITGELEEPSSRITVEPGAVFGKWTVLEKNPHKRHGKVLCRCQCGAEREVLVRNLISGRSASCGCSVRESSNVVQPGAVFGKWTVLEANPYIGHGRVLCRCACGREKKVSVGNLLSGLSTSCGCPKKFAPGMMQGNLFVVGHPWLDSKGRRRVKCFCECGRTYFPRTDDLFHGKIQSCRCFHFTSEYRLKMRGMALNGRQAPSW